MSSYTQGKWPRIRELENLEWMASSILGDLLLFLCLRLKDEQRTRFTLQLLLRCKQRGCVGVILGNCVLYTDWLRKQNKL